MTKKIGFWRVFVLKSSLKVPASATPSQVDRVTDQKRDRVPEWVVTSSQEAPSPASFTVCLSIKVSLFVSVLNVESFIDWNMPHRCVVAGCSNVPNSEKGIALHKFPFFGDDRNMAKARRKKWTEFVQLKRAKWSPTASSAVCSCQKICLLIACFNKISDVSGRELTRYLLLWLEMSNCRIPRHYCLNLAVFS